MLVSKSANYSTLILSGLTGNVNGLTGNVNGLTGNADDLTGNADDLTGNVNGLTGNVNGLTGNVNGLTGNVNGFTGNKLRILDRFKFDNMKIIKKTLINNTNNHFAHLLNMRIFES